MPHEHAPVLTAEGISRRRLNPQTFQELLAYYHANATTPEFVKEFISNGAGAQPSTLTDLTDEWRQRLHRELKPICEEWVGRPIVPTYVYGIRTYYDGTTLKMHRDRDNTHIVSAIINIAQDVRVPWPLDIEDPVDGQPAHKELLEPGEILLYEGNRLEHGRVEPLQGNHFVNVFVHYRLP